MLQVFQLSLEMLDIVVSKYRKFPATGDKHLPKPLYDFDDDFGENYSYANLFGIAFE